MKRPQVHQTISFIGSTKVIIQQEDYGPGKLFIHPHANETTALEAARLFAKANGGKIITLIHARTRNIEFTYHGTQCQFDPNRIFTAQGLKKTLEMHGCYDKQSTTIVSAFAQQFLATIPSGKVIAVHNNNSYSLKNYFENQPYARDAAAVFYNPKHFYRNFYLVTQVKDFLLFKSLGYNVVLQSSAVSDDGSLSVVLANQQYINVEAGYGQLFQQMNMLEHA